MKTEIHPEYIECNVTCSCGNQFVTHATVSELRVELCAACHPFYTGKQKLVDTGGRVERFTRRYAQQQDAVEAPATEAPAKRKKRVAEPTKRKAPVSVKGGPRPKYEPPRRGEGIFDDQRGGRGGGRGGRGGGRGAPRGDRDQAATGDKPEAEASEPKTEESSSPE